MADQNLPNDAARKSRAEGERWTAESEDAGPRERARYTGEEAAGITNRPLDEEIANQQSLPERGGSRPGAHAGHGERNTPDWENDR